MARIVPVIFFSPPRECCGVLSSPLPFFFYDPPFRFLHSSLTAKPAVDFFPLSSIE